jgi:hypothetical protein
MPIFIGENRVKLSAKRLKKSLRSRGIEISHMSCLNLSCRLLGFRSYQEYCHRDRAAPESPWDEDLSEEAFCERDAFHKNVLAGAGFGAIAQNILDEVNPTSRISARPG